MSFDYIVISNAEISDITELHEIERLCFSEEKAATLEAFEYRLKNAQKWFFKATVNGKIAGLIDGACSNRKYITDNLYDKDGGFDENGENLLLFGLAVHPDYRHKGIAHKLMKHALSAAKESGKRRVSLTCKERLIPFYESFGYTNHGVSESVKGNVESYDMEILL